MQRITRDDPDYPERLRQLPDTPAITVSRPLASAGRRVVAIVGSREPLPESQMYAYALAGALAASGVVVVSGGALGIDRAAHEGALDAGGTTWVVAPNGKDHVAPSANADLFERVKGSESSVMIWPFRDDVRCDKRTPRARNAVLVALADAVVVVQAIVQSGSRNAAKWARSLNRPLWIVPGAPWMPKFTGSLLEIEHGARPLCSSEELLRWLRGSPRLELVRSPPTKKEEPLLELPPERFWSQTERSIFSALSTVPRHVDGIASETGLGVGAAISALLTLSMKNVVVEGPDGCFRRKSAG